MGKKLSPFQADMLCLVVAVIWGTGFIASEWAIQARMSSALILAGRFSVGALLMLPVCRKNLRSIDKTDLKRGGLAGVFLFIAFYTQIAGQALTSVSHCAFLTATNMVLVPFFVWMFSRKRPSAKVFILAALALAGIGVLTFDAGEAFQIGTGDGLVLVCAVFFALHIFYLGKAVEGRNPMVITLIQLGTAAVLSIATLLLFERDAIFQADLASGVKSVVYLGVFSTCICYLLQTTAQKYTSQSRAGILLATEGLFGALFSVIMGFEPFTVPLVLGGLLIMLAVILLEAPIGVKKNQ